MAKISYITRDGAYRLVYTPQRELSSGRTKLASFDLFKRIPLDDRGLEWVTAGGYATNYRPSRGFPLAPMVDKTMQMLVTDYAVSEWARQS